MKRLVEKLHDNYIAPLIVELIVILLLSADTLELNHLKTLSENIPSWVLYLVSVAFGIWLIIALWNRFTAWWSNFLKSNNQVEDSTFTPRWNNAALLDYDRREFFDVIWEVKRVHGWSDLGRGIDIKKNNVDSRIFVDTQPICPKCDADLEIKKAFQLYHKWFCPICGYSKRTIYYFDKIASRAQNKFRRDIRNEVDE